MRYWTHSSLSASIPLIYFITAASSQDNTSCLSSSLDWYTSVIGETPCKTYERLRQTCNSGYKVGLMLNSAPAYVCDDPNPECCCNSVAFGLSVLCMNCQHDVANQEPFYINADNGSYSKYLFSKGKTCYPVYNRSLPLETQTQVCARGINISDVIYNKAFWKEGSWFYNYARKATKEAAINSKNIFTLCDSLGIKSSAPSSSPTGKQASLSDGAIAGIVIGSILLLLLAAALYFLRKRVGILFSRYHSNGLDPTGGTQETSYSVKSYNPLEWSTKTWINNSAYGLPSTIPKFSKLMRASTSSTFSDETAKTQKSAGV